MPLLSAKNQEILINFDGLKENKEIYLTVNKIQ